MNGSISPRVPQPSVLRSRSNATTVLVVPNARAAVIATRAVSAVIDVSGGGGLVARGGAGEK